MSTDNPTPGFHGHSVTTDLQRTVLAVFSALLREDTEALDIMTASAGCPRCLATAAAQFGLMLAGVVCGDPVDAGPAISLDTRHRLYIAVHRLQRGLRAVG